MQSLLWLKNYQTFCIHHTAIALAWQACLYDQRK